MPLRWDSTRPGEQSRARRQAKAVQVGGFNFAIVPRYGEVDQQGVVFNAHYLTWFDEACTAFLDHLDVSYPGLISSGLDLQVVHTEIDFVASVRWRDAVRVAVTCERIGNTSFTLGFTVFHANDATLERVAVRGRNVYVVVSGTDWTKRPVPDRLRAALGFVADEQAERIR
ncbi:acyl-CoA thioesterase [Mycolicibacterium goodii]|uniref:Acyl-CoA thioesterase n=1 Tax=Mycolicibacterium goodii TaxID=134601 RepID=A0ABS6HVD6_MYCGD|nr:acyl-CoA thioesterase [Mycolicibacterium goodii]MBU8826188.1 acyl-CoA thioesterase [Mycolicibacterium goodii]MBU8839501.1 acyl-CoA thioesterase [Mycolicibacterium goodii]